MASPWSHSLAAFLLLIPVTLCADEPERDPLGEQLAPFTSVEAKRAWFRGLLGHECVRARRMAALWLAGMGDVDAGPVLVEILREGTTEDRYNGAFEGAVVWAAQMSPDEALPILLDRVDKEPSVYVPALAYVRSEEARDRLRRLLEKADGRVRWHLWAAAGLLDAGDGTYDGWLGDAIASRDANVAAEILGWIGTFPRATERMARAILERAADPGPAVRRAAQGSLARNSVALHSTLLEALKGGEPDRALAAARILALAGEPAGRARALEWASSEDPLLWPMAVETLVAIRDPRDVRVLLRAYLEDLQAHGVYGVPEALQSMPKAVATILEESFRDADETGRRRLHWLMHSVPDHGCASLLLDEAARSENVEDLAACLMALGGARPEDLRAHFDEIVAYTSHSNQPVRSNACAALGRSRDARALPVLLGALRVSIASGAIPNWETDDVVRAIGDLGDSHAIEPLLETKGYEWTRSKVLYKLAPERFPPPLWDLRKEADDRARVWDYDGMMETYGRIAAHLQRRLDLPAPPAAPEECDVSTLSPSFWAGFGETELHRRGERVEVIAQGRLSGTLSVAEFERLWNVMWFLEGAMVKGGLDDSSLGGFCFSGDGVGSWPVLLSESGSGGRRSARTWTCHRLDQFFTPYERDGLFEELCKLIARQSLRASRTMGRATVNLLAERRAAWGNHLRDCEGFTPKVGRLPRQEPVPQASLFLPTPPSGPLPEDPHASLLDPAPLVRYSSVLALGETGTLQDLPALAAAWTDADLLVREGAEGASMRILLRAMDAGGSEALVLDRVQGGSWVSRETVIRHCETHRRPRPHLIAVLLGHENPRIRLLGIRLSESSGTEETTPILDRLAIEDPCRQGDSTPGDDILGGGPWYPVRDRAREALRRLPSWPAK